MLTLAIVIGNVLATAAVMALLGIAGALVLARASRWPDERLSAPEPQPQLRTA